MALEFLIKDYACLENPDKEEVIKKTLLGKCINEYILDSNVKACAKRATWLGNDETHYVRKWTDQDISDLKIDGSKYPDPTKLIREDRDR